MNRAFVSTGSAALDDRPGPGWPIVLGSLFVLSTVWHLAVLARLARTPLLGSLNADADAYWGWAGLLRAHGWMGRNPFFLAPLYPYWLAVVRSFAGDSVLAVLRVQALLAALACVLLADAARRLTNPGLGAIVGLLAAGYTMSGFFALLVLSESLLFTLEAAFVWLLVAWRWRESPVSGALLAGTLIGIMAHGRAIELVLLLPLGVLLLGFASPLRALRAWLASIAMVTALATPVALRHRALVNEWIPYTYSLGYNLYIGNGPSANGTFVLTNGFVRDLPARPTDLEGGVDGDTRDDLARTLGMRLSPLQSSNYWMRRTQIEVLARPARAARLYVRKLGMLVNAREVPQIEDVEAYRRVLGPLGLPVAGSFAFVGVLGLLGAALAMGGTARERALAIYVLVTPLVTAVFFVTDRYRYHLVPALMPLAAVTLSWAGRANRLRSGLALATGGLAATACAGIVFLPLIPRDPEHEEWGAALMMGEAWLRAGKPDSALRDLDQAAAIDDSMRMRNADLPSARILRAAVFEDRGIAQAALGHPGAAIGSYVRASQLAPDAITVHEALGELYALQGCLAESRTAFLRAHVDSATASRVLTRRAQALDRSGDTHGLENCLSAAVALDPHNEEAAVAIVRALAMTGHPDSARTVLDRARANGLDEALYAAHRAMICALEGDRAGALKWRHRIPVSPGARDPRVRATLGMTDQRSRVHQ